MENLVINQKGIRLSAEHGRLVIHYPDQSGKQPSSICLQRLKQVVVTACIELDSAVLHLLSSKGIHMSFYSPRSLGGCPRIAPVARMAANWSKKSEIFRPICCHRSRAVY
uniref:CRISPR-associated endonuclease Cas1 n=1 Tax=Endozoicomonas sp. ONNA2 TaxID=2828741 RepID=UPI0021473546